MKYPKTKKEQVTDTYFGVEVNDTYRWLEENQSSKTANWIKEQNECTFDYLSKIPFRNQIQERLKQIMNYERISAPRKHGKYNYFYKNDGLQNQYVLYRTFDNGEPEVFLDPNNFSEDGTTSLGEVCFSKDGSLVAYSISEGGSDWRKVLLMDTETKRILEKPLENVKFSEISWLGNEGIFYSSYDKPTGSELSALTDRHKLYFHKRDTKQTDDKVIFGDKVKRRYVMAKVMANQKYLIIEAANTTSGNELYYKDLTSEKNGIVQLVDNFDYNYHVVTADENHLFIETNLQAPNQRLLKLEVGEELEQAEELIPNSDDVLECSTGNGYLFANYTVHALSKVVQYSMEGEIVREVELPGIGTVDRLEGDEDQTVLYYTFSNYIYPETVYRFDSVSGKSELQTRPKIDFNSDDYESKQVFYPSKDGTKIPLILTYKKGMNLNGKNPTLLYGYGGFNISLTPSFSPTRAIWIEMGGILAVANLRGGGEYGKPWHDAGTKQQKQNVFDDFINAGEFLIEQKYTSSNFLAIQGGSNGGLLVGAVMTQRPDLAKVALPAVGVLDMLRYHTFTSGAGWAYDFGTAEESLEMFEYLHRYSPLHNVKEGTEYPSTLITTGDHDDRVVPAHSFKFAAELQAKQSGTNPTLIRIETNAGHGAGTPISKIIEQNADIYGFALHEMGIESIDW